MIRYALRCSAGHEFDGWFRSGEDFDRQRDLMLVSCAHCGDLHVDKALMRPAVAGTKEGAKPAPEPVAGGIPPEKAAELRARLQEIGRELRAGSHYVGNSFAEEARRIHFGESEERRIHGEATAAEVKALAEEGVPAFPLPPLPGDRH